MQHKLVGSTPLRVSVAVSIVLFVSSLIFAQNPPIEPCPATPPPKPTTSAAAPQSITAKASETIVDSSIADDEALKKLLAPYAEEVHALSVLIGTLDTPLKKSGVGAGTVGNMVTDAMLAEARKRIGKNVVFAITNAGGLRKNDIAAGQLHASDIFELLPFENRLIVLDLTGAQLAKLMQFTTRDAQSGARIQYRWNEQNRPEVIGAKLLNVNGSESEIDDKALYSIVTIDYLYKLNSGNYALLQEGKNLKWLDVTIRDAVTDYIKAETVAGRSISGHPDGRFVQIGPSPEKQENRPND